MRISDLTFTWVVPPGDTDSDCILCWKSVPYTCIALKFCHTICTSCVTTPRFILQN